MNRKGTHNVKICTENLTMRGFDKLIRFQVGELMRFQVSELMTFQVGELVKFEVDELAG